MLGALFPTYIYTDAAEAGNYKCGGTSFVLNDTNRAQQEEEEEENGLPILTGNTDDDADDGDGGEYIDGVVVVVATTTAATATVVAVVVVAPLGRSPQIAENEAMKALHRKRGWAAIINALPRSHHATFS